MRKNSASDPSVVYLLKSTYYPDLRQKILNVLSLPNDLELIVEYDSKWIAEEIRKNPENFEGMDACVIFVDYSSGSLDSWPLRLCKITKIIPPADGATYQIILKLGEHRTATNSEFSSGVRDYLQQKQVIETSKGSLPKKLVFSGDNSILKMLAKVGVQQDTWENIVKHLVDVQDIIQNGVNQEQFKHSVFYRLSILPREELGSPLRPKEGVYELDPGKQYSLAFAVYHPHYRNFDVNAVKETVVDFPDGLLHHVGSKTCSLPARQRKYTKYFDLWTKDLMAGGKSGVVVRLENDEFNGPSVYIPFVLHRKRLQVASWFLLLTVGLFLLGSSTAIASMAIYYGFTQLSRTTLEWITSISGTVLSLLPIAWLELKRSATT